MATIYTDFTKRDYTANFERLLALLTEEVPELTDRNHSDAGISILRLLARQTDMLSFYIDEAFIEGYVSTARFKQSLIELGTLVDCRPKLSSPASTTLVVTRGEVGRNLSYTIPANSLFTRDDGIAFTNIDPIIIPVGTESVSFESLQMEYNTADVGPGEFEYFCSGRRLMMNLGTNIAANSVTMYDITSEWYWTEVDSFYRSMPTDTHFMLEVYADNFNGQFDTVFLSIGDGIYGTDRLPQSIRIGYYTTSGASGNSGSGVVINMPDGYNRVFTVTNATPATGGSGVETTERFRARLPLVVQTQRRGVTELDYQTLIVSVPGVLACQAVSRASDVSWPYLYVFLYVLPEGGGAISEYLRTSLLSQCMRWGHMGDWENRYVIMDANSRIVDVSVRIGKTFGFQQSAVSTSIRTALSSFFLPENRLIGQSLSFSDLHRAIAVVQGVDWVEFQSPASTVVAEPGDTFILGTVTINYGS